MTPEQRQARQAALRQFVFDVPTQYVLEAPSKQEALAWFSSDPDLDIDCRAMQFGKPRLVVTLPKGAEVPPLPQTPLQRFAERFRAATRPILPGGWTFLDVPVIALEELPR